MHNGMIVQIIERALRSVRMPPVGAARQDPPMFDVVEGNAMTRHDEHQRPRMQRLRRRARIITRVARDLGHSDVARRLDELAKLRVGDEMTIHPEWMDA